jgi:Tol biopolymer transport system component
MSEAKSRSSAGKLTSGFTLSATLLFSVWSSVILTIATPAVRSPNPQIQTDKSGYLAGEPIRISGEGFLPLENVRLEFTHAEEASTGQEPLLISADAAGSFAATWSIDRHDTSEPDFVLTAEGAGGSIAKTLFARIATIRADRTSPDAVTIVANGFNAGEPLSINVDDGHDHPSATKWSDADGSLTADLELPTDNPDATVFRITIASPRSGLSTSYLASDYAVVTHRVVDAVSQPVPPQSELTQMGWLDRGLYDDFFISWNATAAWTRAGQTGDACALFDSDGDPARGIDFAICGQIANAAFDRSSVVQTAESPLVFSCDNRQSDRCGSRLPYASAAEIRNNVRAGSLPDLRRDKTFLPPGAKLVDVCSYRSVTRADAGEDGPMDCIVSPVVTAKRNVPALDQPMVAALSGVPALAGRIVYHSYVSYDDGSSQLFIMDLSSGRLTNVSSSWTNVRDAMNAHWSPDGTKIVFMGRPKKGNSYSTWFDVFMYVVGQPGNPINLTNTASRHDEDPKFSPDGTKIVYKVRPSTLYEMDLNGNIVNTIVSSSGNERSMPYYTPDGAAVWFSQRPKGAASSFSSIHRINVNGANDTTIVDTPGVIDYYPIRDTIGQFLYSRTMSSTDLHGQVYLFDGVKSVSLTFNTVDADYSDAFPIDLQYVVLSSTRAGGSGGYDLVIADRNSGAMWSLNGYNGSVNTTREELGAAYTPTQ